MGAGALGHISFISLSCLLCVQSAEFAQCVQANPKDEELRSDVELLCAHPHPDIVLEGFACEGLRILRIMSWGLRSVKIASKLLYNRHLAAGVRKQPVPKDMVPIMSTPKLEPSFHSFQ